jgi:hypothetical protein
VSDPRLHIFGVRHHGPGSAHSLVQALDALQPAAVLIEGPPEANGLIEFAGSPQMRTPLALLIYAVEDPAYSSFDPFAEFSPEWQAIQWTIRKKRSVRFIDLPTAHTLAARKAAKEAWEAERKAAAEAAEAKAEEGEEEEQAGAGPSSEAGGEEGEAGAAAVRRDPLAYLAELAGYDDSEAWWNALIEQGAHAPEIFASIESAMTALRAAMDGEPSGDPARDLREQQREAHMRLAIAEALKEFDGAIAIVCGAWHVPALRRKAANAEDKALLKNLPRLKVTATWAPWTNTRLTIASGYGAGIASPGWYSHLWGELRRWREGGLSPRAFTAHWQTRVARQSGRVTATASVIEAVRLAETLAALRELPLPGLQEMRDASLATLCHGEVVPLRLIEEKLIVGSDVGAVDPDVPQMPLQADLTRQQKRLKLKPEALENELSLDLRSDAGLAKSLLLHRLNLINVAWGKLTDPGGSRGTFRERWMLRWDPEFSVRLAEAIIHGPTIAEAAGNAAISRAKEAAELSVLSAIVQSCLLADLGTAARTAIRLLQAKAAVTSDVGALAAATPPLATILRYGAAREMPEDELRLLATSLIEAVCAGLVYACRNLDRAAAGELHAKLTEFDRALPLLRNEGLTRDWRNALRSLSGDAFAAALLRGFAVRTLYNQSELSPQKAQTLLSRALSPPAAPAEAGEWLEGFLSDGGQMLLHDAPLFSAIDAWLLPLGEEDFTNLLPMLRRAFAGCDAGERRRLLDMARQSVSAAPAQPGCFREALLAPASLYKTGHGARFNTSQRSLLNDFCSKVLSGPPLAESPGSASVIRCQPSQQSRWHRRSRSQDSAPCSRSWCAPAGTSHNAHSPKSLKGKGLLIRIWC